MTFEAPTAMWPLLILPFLLGSTAWNGIDVSDADLARWRSPMSFATNVNHVYEVTKDISVDELMQRCRVVLDERRVRGRESPERDALLCAVAVRRAGDTSDFRWLPVLDELHPVWTELYVMRLGRVRSPAGVLVDEGLDAYRKIVIEPLTTEEFLNLWIEIRLEGRRTFEAMARSRAFNNMLEDGSMPVEELVRLYQHPDSRVRYEILTGLYPYRVPGDAPELFDAIVAAVSDPDPDVRRIARHHISYRAPDIAGRPSPTFVGEPFVRPLLRLIERTAPSDEGRTIAIEALQVRGYLVTAGPNKRPMAVPLASGEEPITLPDE